MNEPTVTISGNLTNDPELRFTSAGLAVTNFTVAVTGRQKQDGEWKDGEPSFYRVTAWRDMAEHVSESLHKGDRVVASGSLKVRKYEKDGVERTSVEIDADDIGASVRWTTLAIQHTERSGPAHDTGLAYQVQPHDDRYDVRVGWDRRLSTFFAEVADGDALDDIDDDQLTLWVGTRHREITDIDTLAEAIRDYADLDPAVEVRLYSDAHEWGPSL